MIRETGYSETVDQTGDQRDRCAARADAVRQVCREKGYSETGVQRQVIRETGDQRQVIRELGYSETGV